VPIFSLYFYERNFFLLVTRESRIRKTQVGEKGKGKGKAIPLQTLTSPEDSRRLRLPDFKTVSIGRW
jgi:hypothetical protein